MRPQGASERSAEPLARAQAEGLRRSLGAAEWVKVEGKVDEGRGMIVRPATASLECEVFKSLMVLSMG